VNDGKIFAIMGYLWILCIVPLVFKKENKFVLNHSRQGLVIFIGVVTIFVFSIIFEWLLRPGLFLFGVLSLWGILAALCGKDLKIPLIRDYADKINL
ncbi:MAG: hypothetical protein NT079_04960, partial [Candidatus Omnitrophica bacterium]|nr:hypothetical protein [Candidatus Omnitrophota bacterium]